MYWFPRFFFFYNVHFSRSRDCVASRARESRESSPRRSRAEAWTALSALARRSPPLSPPSPDEERGRRGRRRRGARRQQDPCVALGDSQQRRQGLGRLHRALGDGRAHAAGAVDADERDGAGSGKGGHHGRGGRGNGDGDVFAIKFGAFVLLRARGSGGFFLPVTATREVFFDESSP